MMHHGNRTRGFTVVELLIVIVVIAILAAVTILAFTGMRSRAALSSVKADTQKLVKALELQKAETAYPATVDATASTLPNMKLSGSNQVAKYTTSGTTFRACIIALDGSTVTAYAIYDSTSGSVMTSGTGAGPASDCTPPPPEFVNGTRCPVMTFGVPFAHPTDATLYRVRVTYSDTTISRITDINGQAVYIDQGALDRYDFPRATGVSWNSAPMAVRGTNGLYRYDCTVTWSWPAG